MVLTTLLLTVLLSGSPSQELNLSKYGSLSRQQTVRENLRVREATLEIQIEERRREMVRRNTPTPVIPAVVLVGRERPRIVGYANRNYCDRSYPVVYRRRGCSQ